MVKNSVHDPCDGCRGIDDDGVVAAPLQLATDRTFPGAGNAVDSVVFDTHLKTLPGGGAYGGRFFIK
jgi:hypothetical protein